MSRKQPQKRAEAKTEKKAAKTKEQAPQVETAPASNKTPDPAPESTTRRGIMSAKEVTSDVIRNYNSNFVDPWLKAMKSWVAESEKFQQTAVEGLNKAIDNSHRLAKEGIEMATSIGTTLQKQVTAQVERTSELVQSMIP